MKIASFSSTQISPIDDRQGDFTMAAVNLAKNNLTSFKSAVFLKMLEQMNLPFAKGYVDLEASTLFDYSSNFIWWVMVDLVQPTQIQ